MRKVQLRRCLLCILAFLLSVIGYGLIRLHEYFPLEAFLKVQKTLFICSVSIVTMVFLQFLLANHILKGWRYFWHHWRIKNRLEKQMLDAGFGIKRTYHTELPGIKLSFAKDFSKATLIIKNSVKFDKKLDDMVLSAGLGRFTVENHYQMDDSNSYVYELLDASASYKMVFSSFEEFLEYSRKVPTYSLFLDARYSNIPLHHILLIGQTGSGKSVQLLNFLLQMISKDVPYQLYMADHKNSNLAILSEMIDKNKTAIEVDDIIALLEMFVSEMHKRQAELKSLKQKKRKVDSSYFDFGLSPHVFICEEYASFYSVLKKREKKIRDQWESLLYEVVLKGREAGFFVMLVMQKTDATLIGTALRENVPIKIVLGNSGEQTYITAFGNGVSIPKRHYSVGEGVFTEPTIAPDPKLIQCAYCDFDLMEVCESVGCVTTHAKEKNTHVTKNKGRRYYHAGTRR